jgi:hypothetical protein
MKPNTLPKQLLNKMASKYIPGDFALAEYQPTMVGIPTAAVKDYYDRMDRQFYTAQEEAGKLQTVLATQLANSAEGDKSYVQGYFDQVKSLIDDASEKKDFQNRVLQIRNVARSVIGDPDYQTVVANGKLVSEIKEKERQLAMMHGAENVVYSGHDPYTFTSFDEEGKARQFLGGPTRRPDYDKAMLDLFERNTEVTANIGALQEFLGSGAGLTAYQNTPEGRVQINDLSKQMFGQPFIELGGEDQMGVLQTMQDQLLNAGRRKIAERNAGRAQQLSPDMKKLIETEPVVAPLPAITDDTEAADRIHTVIDDRISNSLIDDQFNLWANNQSGLIDYQGNLINGFKTTDRSHGGTVAKNVKTSLTTGFDPKTGEPLIQINYQQNGVDGDFTALVPIGNISQQLGEGALGGVILQLQNSKNSETRAQAPYLASAWMDVEFNKLLIGGGDVRTYKNNILGIEVKSENGKFGMYDLQGKPFTLNGKKLTGLDEQTVRFLVGTQYIKNNF